MKYLGDVVATVMPTLNATASNVVDSVRFISQTVNDLCRPSQQSSTAYRPGRGLALARGESRSSTSSASPPPKNT
jgi:hypothetical protein